MRNEKPIDKPAASPDHSSAPTGPVQLVLALLAQHLVDDPRLQGLRVGGLFLLVLFEMRRVLARRLRIAGGVRRHWAIRVWMRL